MAVLPKRQEALLRSLFTHHGRKKHAMCICEGARCCSELVNLQPNLIEFSVCSDEFDDFEIPGEVYRIPSTELKKLSGTISSQGVMIVAKKPSDAIATPPDDPFIFVLDRIADPGNFGTIMRTARAIGLKELWYTSGSVDPYNDKVIRSGMGAQFAMNLRAFESLQELTLELKKFGYNKFFRTDVAQGESCFTTNDLFEKSAIIMGNEANGVGEMQESTPVTIPMPGDAESLNVAQAATIILFEYIRRNS